MYVDWYAPSGSVCEDWNDPKVCDWGSYGSISISGDEYGRADPDWGQITNAEADGQYYYAIASWGYIGDCDFSNPCEVDEVKIYVSGSLVRTISSNQDLGYGAKCLKMPVAAGGASWNTGSFAWTDDSNCAAN
jgi:hypothetical protein